MNLIRHNSFKNCLWLLLGLFMMSPEFSMAQNDCEPNCSPTQYTISTGSNHLGSPMAFGFNPGKVYMEFTNGTGTVTEFCDGTAIVSGDVIVTNNSLTGCTDGVYHVQWNLVNAATYADWTAQGRDYKSRNCTDFEDFTYYELGSATLTGISDCNSGISISFVHRPATIEYGFQIGNGAHNNGLNCELSLGGWYTWTADNAATEAFLGAATGPGDWHANLSGPTTNESACNDGNPNTKDDTYDSDCVCVGKPINDLCTASYAVHGRTVTVSNLTGAIKAVKIYDMSWNTLYSCDDWGAEICDGTESFVVPSCGDYQIQIQTYADWSTPICNLFEQFTVDSDCGGGVPVCKYYKVTNSTLNCSSHAGNEVVFLQKDCGGGPANYWTAGDNLQLKENGDGTATISGIILNGNETGVVHIDLSGFENTGQHWSLACYDDNLVPQYYYTSFNGTVVVDDQVFTIEPKSNGADFVFGNGANSEPNGAFSFGAWAAGSWATCLEVFGSLQPLSHGDACDDGNDTTINDVIGADNCTCAGVPDVPPTDCDATISVNGKTITVNGLNGAIKAVKILDMSWNTLYSCDDWGGTTCGNSVSYTVDACGDYQVQIQTYADWSTPICNELETVTVDSDCGGGPTDCDPGCTPNQYQIFTGSNALESPMAFGFNPARVYMEFTNGTGTVTEYCDGTAVVSGEVVVTNNPLGGCTNGVYFVQWNLENGASYAEWTAQGRDYKSRNCTDFEDFTYYELASATLYGISDCNREISVSFAHRPSTIEYGFQIGNGAHNNGLNCELSLGGWYTWTADNDATEAYLGAATGPGDWHANLGQPTTNQSACNDGRDNTYEDTYDSNCNCMGTPLPQPPGQTFDCPALGANIGDACDDGNANTDDDKVQPNCTCAGDPILSGCFATYSVDGNKITISDLNAPINSAKILNSQWGVEAECSDWSTACNGMLMATVPNGTYFVQIQTYQDWSSPRCDIFEEVVVSGGGTGGCDNVTSGGSIAGDETGCGAYNPGPVTSAALPSGGSGAIEYLWLSSTTGCPRYLTQAIPGANQSTYDPGTITQTTYYVRCSRRAGCDVWTAGESNCVVKTVDNDPNCNGGGGACTIDISVSGNSISVSGAVGPFPNVGIYDDFGNVIYECHAFNGGCPETVTVDNLASGVYWVSGRVIDNDWVTILCEDFVDITIGQAREVDNSNGVKAERVLNKIAVSSKAPNFGIFPNPAQDALNVSLTDFVGKDIQIQVIDQLGKPVRSIKVDDVAEAYQTIDLLNMNNGIYTVRILSDGLKPVGKKVIVNK